MTTVQDLIDELETMDPDTEVALVLRQRHPLQFAVGTIVEYSNRVYIATGADQGYVQDDDASRDLATS